MPSRSDDNNDAVLIALAALAGAFLLFGRKEQEKPDVTTTGQPRGLANKNPLNIKVPKVRGQFTHFPWQGEVVPSQDYPFSQFETFEDGWRAAMKNMNAYRNMAVPLVTPAQIIQRWEGDSNITNWNYVDYVVGRANEINPAYDYHHGKPLPSFTELSYNDTLKIWWPIFLAMAEFENGANQTQTIAGTYSAFRRALTSIRDE